MESLRVRAVDPRTGKVVEGYANWTTRPNNPDVGRLGRWCREVGVVRARGSSVRGVLIRSVGRSWPIALHSRQRQRDCLCELLCSCL